MVEFLAGEMLDFIPPELLGAAAVFFIREPDKFTIEAG